jgi:hypothetical protein
MLREHENMLSAVVVDYGPAGTVQGLVEVLRQWADQYSDMVVKEKAIEYAEWADKLEAMIKE